LIILSILDEEYKYAAPHYAVFSTLPVTSALVGPNILLCTVSSIFVKQAGFSND
jgi:hypothetical protein